LGPMPDYDAGPIVFCFWHGRQAGLLAHPCPRPVAILSSLSRDGTLQAKILSRLGYIVRRGSSSRGGANGLKAIIAEIKQGCDAAFAVDGPRGPLHKVKPGAIEAARLSGAQIIPITMNASRFWTFKKTWDQYTLPKPFAKVSLIRGQCLSLEDIDTNVLEKALNSLRGRHHPR